MLCERTTEQALSERLNEYFWVGRVFEKVSQPVSARTLQLISERSVGRRFASLCRQSGLPAEGATVKALSLAVETR